MILLQAAATYEHRDDATFYMVPICQDSHVRVTIRAGKGPKEMMWTPGARSMIRKGDDVRFELVNEPGKVVFCTFLLR